MMTNAVSVLGAFDELPNDEISRELPIHPFHLLDLLLQLTILNSSTFEYGTIICDKDLMKIDLYDFQLPLPIFRV